MENVREVYRAHRDAQNRYTYFLLAAAGAAIALAVNQTHRLPLAVSQVPLAAGVLCWGLSFFFGCRYLDYVSATLYANVELFRVQSGRHPDAGAHPEVIAAASDGIRAAMESNSDAANRLAKWQFRFLVVGAVFYVGWHVLEMYIRAAGGSVCI